MMLRSPLNSRERHDLERAARTEPGRVSDRIRMVLLAARGFSLAEIARVYDCPAASVAVTIDAFEAAGLAGLRSLSPVAPEDDPDRGGGPKGAKPGRANGRSGPRLSTTAGNALTSAAWLLAIASAAAGQYLLSARAERPAGLSLFGLGIILFLAGLLAQGRRLDSFFDAAGAVRAAGRVAPLPVGQRALGWAIAVIALALLAFSYVTVNLPNAGLWSLGCWIAGLIAALTAAALLSYPAARSRRPGRESLGEIGIVAALVAIGAILRLYDPAGYPSGIHGDEAGLGLIAERILGGTGPHPFGTEFLATPAVFMYSEAPFVALFGRSIGALRVYAGISGTLTLPVFYLLVRSLFGARVGLFALALLAGSAVHVNFSRIAVNVAQTPLLTCLAILAIWQGIVTRRPFWWLAGGIAGGLAAYLHSSGRLVPFVIGAYFAYLFLSRRSDWRGWAAGAAWTLLGGLLTVAPMILFTVGHNASLFEHETGRLIFNDWARATGANGTTNPIGVIGNQLLENLLIFFSGVDRGQFFTFAGTPMVHPLLGPLTAFGLALITWRVGDPRCALLAIWFWLWLTFGGVLTLDSPQAHRLLTGLPPVVAGIALVLGAIAGWARRAAGRCLVAAVTAAAAVIVFAAGTADAVNYFGPAAAARPWAQATVQATFVASLGPGYRAYTLGTPEIYFGHEVTRFLAPEVEGDSLSNPGARLPLAVPADKDVAFLVYPRMSAYLPILQTYYGAGQREDVRGPKDETLFTVWRVPRSEVARWQGLTVHVDGQGRLETDSRALGAPATVWPADVTWSGSLHADRAGPYRLLADPGAEVRVDGAPIGTAARELAAGWHTIEVRGRLAGPEARLAIRWQPPGEPVQPIPPGRLDGRSLPTLQGARVVSEGGPGDRWDQFIGFRDVAGLWDGRPARPTFWEGQLSVATPGRYEIGVASAGRAEVSIDGQPVVLSEDGDAERPAIGTVALTPGAHRVLVNYAWLAGSGLLELYWRPPGGQLEIIPPHRFRTSQ